MADKISIFSQNCQGLANPQKRRSVFRHIRLKKYNIICLQDVHIQKLQESYIKSEWGYNIYFSCFNNSSRGVMVLLNNNFEHEVERVYSDINGNYIILDINIEGKKFTLVSLYGPNDDKPSFYKEIRQKYNAFQNDKIIICGDWNLVINPDLDTNNYLHINNPRARQEVLNMINEEDFVDIYRELNGDKREYTWSRRNPVRKQARLDFFLVNDDCFPYTSEAKIIPGYRSDHSGILLELVLNTNERGRGYWKFNNSLLKDQQYVNVVKNTISEVKQTYQINNEENNIDNQEEFSINDQLFLETLLLMIRGNTIKYSSQKKKQRQEQENKLEHDIKQIEEEVNANFLNMPDDVLDELENKKSLLNEIQKEKIEGVMLRSRSRYADLGEKPTRYFFNLEKRNFTSKVIHKLVNEEGEEVSDTSDVLKCQTNFYKSLYSEVETDNSISIQTVLGDNEIKLSDEESQELEGELTHSELAYALRNMKNNKSPGLDGFTVEFFKFFWIDVGQFILRSLNYGYRTGSLSITQKQGIITCIPKPNKPRINLKNWRPISLLNVTYKLASAVISNRLKKVLDKVIHENQKGFIAGRFLGENIRLIYDVLFESKKQNIPGLLLSVDFEKAFDTVSWTFISKVLDYFNFGRSIKTWISLFQNGAESCILQNGFMSEFFNLKRGCRQGDPISPYIFILCAEILGKMIRNNKDIKGIQINGKEYKLSQYADDTQVLLDGSENSLKEALGTLKKYYTMSGLKVNVDKTRALWIGSLSNSEETLCEEHPLDWSQEPLKALGVVFSPLVFNIWDLNSQEVVLKIKNILNKWSRRKLTLIGRITIIKSLALSKFVHLFISLPAPPNELIKELEKMFYKFLWNSGPDRIKRRIIIKNTACAGLRMVELTSFIKALKVSWLRRILQQSETGGWNELAFINFSKLFSFGGIYAAKLNSNLRNPFWKDLMQVWCDFCKAVPVENIKDILICPLWHNERIGNGQLFLRNWCDMGIRVIKDLLNEEGIFYSFEQLKEKYNIRGTFLDYQHVLNSIPQIWKDQINMNRALIVEFRQNVVCNIYLQYLIKSRKGSRIFYDILVGVNKFIPQAKWQVEMGNIGEEEWKMYYRTLKSFHETKLRDFQYKINNKILVTNSFLFKINKIDNQACSYCNEHPEKIDHLFLRCPKVRTFWIELKTWLATNTNLEISLEDRKILFSCGGKTELVNYIYVLAKYYIYKTKFVSRNISVQGFVNLIKKKMLSERYISFINNRINKFLKKWHFIYNYFYPNTDDE